MRVVMHARVLGGCLAAIPVSIGVAGVWADAAVAAPSRGMCHVGLPVTISRPHRGESVVHVFGTSTGSASCSGSLGPWLMSGRPGWSEAAGSFRILRRSLGGASPSGFADGGGQLWAAVPRFAWFHAPMVELAASFRVRSRDGVLRLAGRGRLVPTRESPVGFSFRIAGTGKVIVRSGDSGARRRGRLALEFSVTGDQASPRDAS